MATKKSRLCWDDIDSLDSRALAEWGAFRSPHVETVDLDNHHVETATFAMNGSGFSCELTYCWQDDEDAVTVRERIQLYRSPRMRNGRIAGHETMFLCPGCRGRAKRLALLRHGAGCAKCCEIKWGSERESKIARLVRRVDEIAGALNLKHWYGTPQRPKGMRLARYMQLVHRRQQLLAQLASHLARRRRLRGNNKKYLHETMLAMGR